MIGPWVRPMSSHSVKFHKDLISCFSVILLTDKQTDRQTDRHGWKHNLLGRSNYRNSLLTQIVSVAEKWNKIENCIYFTMRHRQLLGFVAAKEKASKRATEDGEDTDAVSSQQRKAFHHYAHRTQSIELVKDDCIQKVNFRVRDKVHLITSNSCVIRKIIRPIPVTLTHCTTISLPSFTSTFASFTAKCCPCVWMLSGGTRSIIVTMMTMINK